jgi:hypothetical protein
VSQPELSGGPETYGSDLSPKPSGTVANTGYPEYRIVPGPNLYLYCKCAPRPTEHTDEGWYPKDRLSGAAWMKVVACLNCGQVTETMIGGSQAPVVVRVGTPTMKPKGDRWWKWH